MNTLPAELKSHIGSFLKHPADLANWARTSSAFLSPARWFLYRKVELASDMPHLEQTVDLICRDPVLKRTIASIKFITRSYRNVGKSAQTWIDLSLFNGMHFLREIAFDSVPCVPAKDFQTILAEIYRQCPALQNISAINIRWPDSSATPEWVLNDEVMAPPSLRSVAFKCARFSSEMRKFFISTFYHPDTELKVLELGIQNNAEIFRDISGHIFGALETLIITGFTSDVQTELIDFLSAHPTIETLSVYDATALPTLGLVHGAKNILPNIRSITATPQFVGAMVTMCDTVKLVHSLTLDFANTHMQHFVMATESMFNLVVGGFPNLKHCALINTYSAPNAEATIRLFAESSRELEWWTGGFYYHDRIALNDISDALSLFPMLKRADICEWSSPPPTLLPSHREGLETMMERNLALKKVCLYMAHTENLEVATVLDMHRKKGMREVYKYVEGGPYIQDRRCVKFDAMDWQQDITL